MNNLGFIVYFLMVEFMNLFKYMNNYANAYFEGFENECIHSRDLQLNAYSKEFINNLLKFAGRPSPC